MALIIKLFFLVYALVNYGIALKTKPENELDKYHHYTIADISTIALILSILITLK